MHIVPIGWLYVALMMAVVEASASNGTVLGGIITFVIYGVAPVALVLYLMQAPARRKAIRRREAQGVARPAEAQPVNASDTPDAGGHSAAGAGAALVTAVREEA